MQIKVNDLIDGTIETIAFGGEGIMRPHGFVVFVPFTAPGDLITCRITEVKKSFAKGLIHTLQKGGPNRVPPPCPYFGRCGGCQIQHLNDAAQMHYKEKAVKDALERVGHLKSIPIKAVPAQEKWAYRRHITLHLKPMQGSFTAGYIGADNHSLIEVQTCPIFNPSEDPVIQQLQKVIRELPNPQKVEGRVTLLKSKGGRYILSFSFEPPFDINKNIFKQILQHYPIFEGIIFKRGKETVFFGEPFTEVEMDALRFRITPQTFIQNHPEQSKNIYNRIREIIGKEKEKKVLDLYCGFGMLALLLAKEGHAVTGIEYNEEAIRFAQASAVANKCRAEFIQGDVGRILPKWAKKEKPDAILVNPPRIGLAKEVLQTLLRINPPEIIYVSCMPATLARDLSLLCQEKYSVEECQVYDMFPQTAHVETLVHLKRKN